MKQSSQRVVITGAGIGGLTAAIGLRQQGHEVMVLERAPDLRAVGAGVTVQINAVRALAVLGLDGAVKAAGQAVTRGLMLKQDGEVIAETDLGEHARRFGAPCLGMHRADLQRILLEALGADRVRLGAEVTGFVEESDGVSALLGDGTRVTGDVLVGADGLHSAVRRQLHGQEPPRYAGYTTWRGVCPNPGQVSPDTLSESYGEGLRFGVVPIGGRRIYWFAVADAPEGEVDPGEHHAELTRRFAGWHAPVDELLRATPESAIFRTDIHDRPAVHPWGRGRVTLLGDAIHPMTPNLGQGACQAIEDGVVLSRLLAGVAPTDLETTLRAFEERRRVRTEAVVDTARRVGQLGQLKNPVLRGLRDFLMHHLPVRFTDKQLDWLYGHEL